MKKKLKGALNYPGRPYSGGDGIIQVLNDRVHVWHFGTLIPTVDTNGHNPVVEGGWSNTDQMIINAVLQELRSDKWASRKGGGLYLV